MTKSTRLEDFRRFYAKQMVAVSGSNDPRLELIFETVPREAFLPPGPWRIVVLPWQVETHRGLVETPDADPAHLYQDSLVALKREKGINNGSPFLHAGWIGLTAPQQGETIAHVGAGTGYYTAILSLLALPDGRVHAYEIEPDLAEMARENLKPYKNVEVVAGNAVELDLPLSDLIYINAGVCEPPVSWLNALKPGGRMIFPWRPAERIGIALLVTRAKQGPPGTFALKTAMPSWFIPCVGASKISNDQAPNREEAWSVRSLHLTEDRQPDESTVVVYENTWFSNAPG